MKHLHQLLACFLALGFALAGAVGLSPTLHRWVEHGGHGPEHTHSGITKDARALSVWHDDGDGHWHEHQLHPPVPEPARSHQSAAHRHEFELPQIPLSRLLLALSHFLESVTPNPSAPAKNLPEHQHYGLPHMLLTGLLDQCSDFPSTEYVFTQAVFLAPVAEVPLLAGGWDAQSLSRGPPASRS